jgi:ornithine carbamoyltransferase
VAGARALQRDAGSGGVPALLRGRYIGLMSDTIDNDEARLFTCAAAELGARVAHIVPTLSDSSTEDEVRRTARMLGACMTRWRAKTRPTISSNNSLTRQALPIYESISSAQHPTARLADLPDGDWSTKDKRKFVIQALLVGSIP